MKNNAKSHCRSFHNFVEHEENDFFKEEISNQIGT